MSSVNQNPGPGLWSSCVLLIVGCAVASAAPAQDDSFKYTVPPLDQVPLFSDKPVRYNGNERRSVEMARDLQRRKLTPGRGADGSVRFVFGQGAATVVCSPLHICTVSLEPGETVENVVIGDSARWKVDPAFSGAGASRTAHAVIKPTDVSLSTNAMITTDRRVYHLTLKSARRDYMPAVSFIYPEHQQRQWREQHAVARETLERQQSERARGDLGGIGLNVEDLNFNYELDGDFAWKPLRVFDDGVKTYVELPPSAVTEDVPIVLVEGGGTDEIVNYRLKANRYIIDARPARFFLIKGVGRQQQRLAITRRASRGSAGSGDVNDSVRIARNREEIEDVAN